MHFRKKHAADPRADCAHDKENPFINPVIPVKYHTCQNAEDQHGCSHSPGIEEGVSFIGKKTVNIWNIHGKLSKAMTLRHINSISILYALSFQNCRKPSDQVTQGNIQKSGDGKFSAAEIINHISRKDKNGLKLKSKRNP